jgi:hypothetical protein
LGRIISVIGEPPNDYRDRSAAFAFMLESLWYLAVEPVADFLDCGNVAVHSLFNEGGGDLVEFGLAFDGSVFRSLYGKPQGVSERLVDVRTTRGLRQTANLLKGNGFT